MQRAFQVGGIGGERPKIMHSLPSNRNGITYIYFYISILLRNDNHRIGVGAAAADGLAIYIYISTCRSPVGAAKYLLGKPIKWGNKYATCRLAA